ncbi:MAG: hypothetical protein ACXVCF_18320 [Isosphaeraceae bacterium]
MQAAEQASLTTEQLAAILERLTVARTVTDVNIAAGMALNELRGTDD